MNGFDPAAATAAYMATLSPAQHARATAYTHGGEWLLLWGWVVSIAIMWLIVRSGVLVGLRQSAERDRPRPNRAVAVCALVFFAAAWLGNLPWTIYAAWWRERSYGLSSQAFGSWLRENLIVGALDVVVSALFCLALFALIRRSPRHWWIGTSAITAVFLTVAIVLAPVLIEPIFNTYTPAPPGPVRDAVVALAKQVGVPSDKIFIYNGSRQSNRYTANVSGLGGSARVAMSDVMFAQGADLAEVRGVVGHEMGHYVLNHAIKIALADSVLAALGFFIVARLFGWTARVMGARGLAGIADPTGLPVLFAIFTTLGVLGTPLFNTITRTAEAQADRFSLVHANEPDGLSKALVKTIEYRASSPSAVEEFLFYDHPSVERRVRRAMEWKAAHPAPDLDTPPPASSTLRMTQQGDDGSFAARLRSARAEQGLDADAGAGALSASSASAMGVGMKVGVELVAALVVGLAIGWGLDRWLHTMPLFLVIFVLLGGAAGVVNVWRMMGPRGS